MSDDEEFQKIHEAFRPKIHRYLTHLVGEHEAEDLTQELDFCSTLTFELDANSGMRPFLRPHLRGVWDSGSRHSYTPKCAL
jgi:hypothetical protein